MADVSKDFHARKAGKKLAHGWWKIAELSLRFRSLLKQRSLSISEQASD